MPLQQGPLGPHDVQVLVAAAQAITVPVSASGDTVLVTCPSYQNGENPAYRPVIYVASIDFAIPAGNGDTITIKGSDGTILYGPAFVGTFTRDFDGGLSTNACALGSNLVINLATAPSAAFGITIKYWFT
jgi:hypothetical protein